MTLWIVAYLGGVLSIFSPCVLPVLPFVFARSDRAFRRNGLPLLLGMTLTFALVATLAAVGGGWVVRANQYGRDTALILTALFGLALLFPAMAEFLGRPFVALGGRLSVGARQADGGAGASIVLGIGTGLLWAPCAGPILGLILAGAAANGASLATTWLLLAYALGAGTSLALALLAGGRLLAALKRSLGTGEWIRRGLGLAVLASCVLIAGGVDSGLLTRVSLGSTTAFEQSLLDRSGAGVTATAGTDHAATSGATTQQATGGSATDQPSANGVGASASPTLQLPVEGHMPSLAGATAWLNSAPLTAEQLRGKVVLVDFWTYSCINCLRALPYVQAWADKYKDAGLVVIGVHAPEFAFERDLGNVQKAVQRLGVTYPVALDNNYAIWQGFNNMYWPAHYFIDAQGRIRHHHFGEGDYAESEQVIQELLKEAGMPAVPGGTAAVAGTGVKAPPDFVDVRSPETYIGYQRAVNFASGRIIPDAPMIYGLPSDPALNQWGLGGSWRIDAEEAVLTGSRGRIAFHFHARDLNLVLGPSADGQPIRFRVTIDGKPPGADHGVDTDADGNGTVTAERLYQLVRQSGPVTDRLFDIEFLDPGVQAYAFTFG